MFKDSYYQIRVSLEKNSHQLFPHLLEEAYTGDFAEEDGDWMLGVLDTEALELLLRRVKELQDQFKIQYSIKLEPIANWNAMWEAGLQPIRIPPQLQVCMYSAQEEEGYEHSIYIQGLNAFGTGHHSTTEGVLRLMLDYDFKSKKVLDLGCGTGILGILAMKLGAEYVEFIDNDMKAIQSTIANLSRNASGEGYSLLTGTLEYSKLKHYDVILANIYRSVLLKHSDELKRKSDNLFLSGYKVEAVSDMRSAFTDNDWKLKASREDQEWVAEYYSKE